MQRNNNSLFLETVALIFESFLSFSPQLGYTDCLLSVISPLNTLRLTQQYDIHTYGAGGSGQLEERIAADTQPLMHQEHDNISTMLPLKLLSSIQSD